MKKENKKEEKKKENMIQIHKMIMMKINQKLSINLINLKIMDQI
eukprot:CAMPEP_0174826352 /NCGR_PEP_ID=MMETSP1107-20130205/43885_1 /TAXON_ID=36770 /ORGANISM="Paraphysomonas vestita, Strain GFlagA" /LENGTH=43 /DNA_ID= /DNA_START= /DNA_END= /DNA_ORIENTATION=